MTSINAMNINAFCASDAYIPTFEDNATETWFILSRQLLEAFGLSNGSEAAGLLSETEYQSKMPACARDQEDAWHFVSESGLYKLILQSDRPMFEAFRAWAIQIVLPIATEDGLYVIGEEKSFMPPVRAGLMHGLDQGQLHWLAEDVLPGLRLDGSYVMLDYLVDVARHLRTEGGRNMLTAQIMAAKGQRSRKIQRPQ